MEDDEEVLGAFKGESSSPQALGELVRRFERGDFDLVAVGRALLTDPAWVAKIKTGRASDLKEFTRESMANYF